MSFIYIMAGAFATVAKSIGGVDATVNFGLSLIPVDFIVPGFFIIAAFIATAMGTSMGTIAAIAPIGLGISSQTEISSALMLGVIVGGAMFGDNLSMISDTTIAATKISSFSTPKSPCQPQLSLSFFFILRLPAPQPLKFTTTNLLKFFRILLF